MMTPEEKSAFLSKLPKTKEILWTKAKKNLVCEAIMMQVIPIPEAKKLYGLSDNELNNWLISYRKTLE
jgi:hypothetical protein